MWQQETDLCGAAMGKWVFISLVVGAFVIAVLPVGTPAGRTTIEGAFILAALVVGVPWWLIDRHRKKKVA